MMLTVNAHEDLVSIVSLRGSENQRLLQVNNCTYLGGVGWKVCIDTNFSCEDSYTCKTYSYMGFQFVKENCVDDSVDRDDENEDDNDGIEDPGTCWKEICSSDNDCELVIQCFIKGNNACACRDPIYSSDCVKSKVNGN